MELNNVKVLEKKKAFSYYEKYMVIVGIMGQFLFYAQGVKIFLSRTASNVSATGFVVSFISVMSWLIYGILIKNKVIIASNVVGVVGSVFVLAGIFLFSG